MPDLMELHKEMLLHIIEILYEQEYLLEEERTSMKQEICRRDWKKGGKGSNL